ncbi:hypothetical protein HDA40_001865 [Hamadaea flava]|uniref:Imm33-like domain-containing protein n=1 Tax=Hamadaea flava TaxID=1742688 RepID=A0ABV8LSU7_9ACTN|nr:hypothetical protein [Hamadaea flava]MCP2323358.1 hypothetical protein [Hamadaea flava]
MAVSGDVTLEQVELCRRFEVLHVAASAVRNTGVSRSMLSRGPGGGSWRIGLSSADWPVYGIRHSVEGGTTGWYLWTGEYSEADDFHVPWHTAHLHERWPEVVPYLALPPGWGFVIAPGYEDVWFDPTRV